MIYQVVKLLYNFYDNNLNIIRKIMQKKFKIKWIFAGLIIFVTLQVDFINISLKLWVYAG